MMKFEASRREPAVAAIATPTELLSEPGSMTIAPGVGRVGTPS